uniref:Phosphatidylinositol transfer protein, alpha a n=1 Tax=Neogobius melanostomus TaxID=47308 RepID=A0A8C6UDB8_9GOBI
MQEKFTIEIITWHKPDFGAEDNIHGLEEAQWKKCKVVDIDIAVIAEPKDYKEEEDPTKFKSKKTGRGPLAPGWKEALKTDTTTPHMCCYKLVKAEFKWKLIQGKVENYIQEAEKRLFTNFHRKLFCTMDDWSGMTMEDIRRMEEETKKELDEMRAKGEAKGTTDDK